MQLFAAFALIAGSFAVAWAVTHYLERRRIAAAEAQFYAKREKLTDDAYLEALPDCATPAFHLAARRAMAKLCGTAAEMIHPGDPMRKLLNLQFDRGFVQDFVFFTEGETDLRLKLEKTPDTETTSFGEFVQQLAQANEIAEASQNSE